MARFENHCAESTRMFGRPYAEVHRWRDESPDRPNTGCDPSSRTGLYLGQLTRLRERGSVRSPDRVSEW